MSFEGNPASVVACVRRAVFALSGSYVTVAVFLSKSTAVALTRPIRFECGQLTDPRATDAESDQDQRRDAAKRARNRRQSARPQLLGSDLHGA
jgi:hypothetical protein